jgi:hypothetical protein
LKDLKANSSQALLEEGNSLLETELMSSSSGRPKSEPGKPKSEPGKPKSEPGKPKSEPGKPKPEPGKPKSEPGKPKPEPDKPGDMVTPFEDDKAREYFYKWFWTGKNGNELIEALNTHRCDQRGFSNPDRIWREKDPPVIYCIIINDDCIAGRDWKLCKVGYTRQPTDKKTNNRMEQVMKEIKEVYGNAAVIFILPIRAIDTTPHFETEGKVRGYVGFKIHKDVAKELKLPVPTEWVLTTQKYIDKLRKVIKEVHDTQVFKEPCNRFHKDKDSAGDCPKELGIGRIKVKCASTKDDPHVIMKA